MFGISIYSLPIILAVYIYQLVVHGLPRFFLVPTNKWQDKILHVIKYPKPIYLNVGRKRSSFRRRLITASSDPSFYNNFTNNKLKIHPTDAKNENNGFMDKMTNRSPKDPNRKIIYGFFHPYANNGGGGEKVLWQAVSATLLEDKSNIVAVYTTNTDAQPAQILQKAAEKFKITDLDSNRVVFIYLRRFSSLIDGAYWKHFTLLGQLFGSVLLGLEAMYELSPDIWLDTIGLPGSYWLVCWILKIPVVAYVHYPIIQPDMFNKLKFRTVKDLRKFSLSAGDFKHLFKFAYWSLLYLMYMYLGSCVDVTLANGTWTYDHISCIWALNTNKVVQILYPPCSTEEMAIEKSDISAKSESLVRENNLLYIAQFRPEKRHALILDNYQAFLEKFRAAKLPISNIPKLVFLGSCRTNTDSSTLDSLRDHVTALALSDHVEFIVDCSFEDLKKKLQTSKFGLNAMWNEHFGIGVVEYLGSGVVPIVHASAGPLLDIVRENEPATAWKNDMGFFFKSECDPDFGGEKTNGLLQFTIRDKQCAFPTLAGLLEKIFIESPEQISEENLEKMRALGVSLASERFSNAEFTQKWMEHIRFVAQLEIDYRETRRDKVEVVY